MQQASADEMTYPQVSGLVFLRVLLALNPVLFSSATPAMFLPQLPRSRGQIYLSVVSSEPNTMPGIENIFKTYLLNEFMFPGQNQTRRLW